ncbi:unnamed protein product [Amoebophrya sp. A120]|nr:unnamed protein product [Amoebophrya sp. A120]|eukprot:GSA120T00007284001.1
MVKKAVKKEQRKLAIELAKKRRNTKPACGKQEDNSFKHVKDKIMRSELHDKDKRAKKLKKQKIRKGRKEAEENGEDPEALGFPKKGAGAVTVDMMREENETIIDQTTALDEEIANDEENDEFSPHFNFETEPKIMLTTNLKPSTKMFDFLKELVEVIPNTKYYKRKGLSLKQIIEYAKKRDFTMLMVVTENKKKVNGMYICNLPEGPTAFFKLTKLKLGQEMRRNQSTYCNSDANPELLLNNFSTRLGRRVARQLATAFPQKPDFNGRRSVTFHNQRDFIFFRHYRYEFKGSKRTGAKQKKKKDSDSEDEEGSDDDMDEDEDMNDSEDSDLDDAAALRKKALEKRKKKSKKAGEANSEDEDGYVNDSGEKLVRAGLKEIGPRFTLKLRYLQNGTFDSKNGEYEYQWRPDSQVSRKKMFL